MKKTIRFLITGVGGQGTILASDILAEVGLRLGHDAKKSDILGLAVRGGSVVSHIIWGGKVRAPMIACVNRSSSRRCPLRYRQRWSHR